MTTTVLRLDSSIFGSGGTSSQLNDRLITSLRKRHDDLSVIHRDLAGQPLPHFDAAYVQALGKPEQERSPEEIAQIALADELIDELRRADILVVGAPMYNFTVPSTLKTWMDYIARAGTTFKYTESGPVGLLPDTKVYINTSRGGLHRDQISDGIVPLLATYFTLLGFNDLKVIYAEGLTLGDDSRRQGLARAEQSITETAA